MSLLLRGARTLDGLGRIGTDPIDIAVSDGLITGVGAVPARAGVEIVDLDGTVVLPAFVDAHLHIDKAWTWRPDLPALSLRDAIAHWRTVKAHHVGEELLRRGRRLLDRLLRLGTTAARTHVDVDHYVELAAVEPLLALRREYADRFTLQVVAYASSAMTPRAPRDLALVEEALAMGADVVGGVPNLDEDPRACIEALLDVADRHRRPLDLHIDEAPPGAGVWLEYLADRVLAEKPAVPVTASHCCALSAMSDADASRVIEKVRAAGISVVACPATNLFLQEAAVSDPVWRGVTRIRSLRRAGVTVAIASDNIRDVYYPYGQGSMLETVFLAALAARFGPVELPALLAMGSTDAARAIGLGRWGLEPGARADLVAFPAAEHLIADRPLPALVMSAGRCIVRPR